LIRKKDAKKVSFRVLNINLDTGTPTGKLMLSMLAAIGQFEREMMLERQQEGSLPKMPGHTKAYQRDGEWQENNRRGIRQEAGSGSTLRPPAVTVKTHPNKRTEPREFNLQEVLPIRFIEFYTGGHLGPECTALLFAHKQKVEGCNPST
jgi:DNA invertase Pin-like site-specific DNA recombinase